MQYAASMEQYSRLYAGSLRFSGTAAPDGAADTPSRAATPDVLAPGDGLSDPSPGAPFPRVELLPCALNTVAATNSARTSYAINPLSTRSRRSLARPEEPFSRLAPVTAP